jgi:hypothetical protein
MAGYGRPGSESPPLAPPHGIANARAPASTLRSTSSRLTDFGSRTARDRDRVGYGTDSPPESIQAALAIQQAGLPHKICLRSPAGHRRPSHHRLVSARFADRQPPSLPARVTPTTCASFFSARWRDRRYQVDCRVNLTRFRLIALHFRPSAYFAIIALSARSSEGADR